MFNNSTNIFIDTLASLQKLDDLERLINPNSAFFQSYRNSLNEINLNYADDGSIAEFPKYEPGPKSPGEPLEHRFATRNLPSLECLPPAHMNPRMAKRSADKENGAKGSRAARLECSADAKAQQNARIGFTRLEPLVENTSEQKSQFSFQKVENIKVAETIKPASNVVATTRCTCTNSRCLKLYCACFSSGETCGPHCQCKCCFNNDANGEIRHKMIEETLQKNPNAFKSKYKRHAQKDAVVHVRGCNCTKTGCVKEYCECFKIGTGCSRLCRCVNCLNKKIDLKNEEVKDYYVKAIRKRRKTKFYEEKFGSKKRVVAQEKGDAQKQS